MTTTRPVFEPCKDGDDISVLRRARARLRGIFRLTSMHEGTNLYLISISTVQCMAIAEVDGQGLVIANPFDPAVHGNLPVTILLFHVPVPFEMFETLVAKHHPTLRWILTSSAKTNEVLRQHYERVYGRV